MIPFYPYPLPQLNAEQMREVDRLMLEVYHIELIQMLDNAGRHLAELARSRFLKGDSYAKRVLILAGTGGNGGGALVAARWLSNAGAKVQVYLSSAPEKLRPVPAHQLDILSRMAVPIAEAEEMPSDEGINMIIDGLIGYSLSGEAEGRVAQLIEWANHRDLPVLALDVPSGFDSTTGQIMSPCIRASATMSLALAKQGLLEPDLSSYVGDLYLANIAVPSKLYAEASLRLKVPDIFRHSDIVQLR